jgi:hypothetical protein
MQRRAAVSLPEKGSLVPKLWGGKGELRATSIGEGRPRRGSTPERDGRWNSGVNPQREGWLQRRGRVGVVDEGRGGGVLGLRCGCKKEEKGR